MANDKHLDDELSDALSGEADQAKAPPPRAQTQAMGSGIAPRPPAPGGQPRPPTGSRPKVNDTLLAQGTAPTTAPPSTSPPKSSTPAPRPSKDMAAQVAVADDPPPRLSRAQAAVEDPYVGNVIADRYKVISKLGEGGMGVVYLAEHVFIEKKVALKVLSEDFARKADLVARFMQEAKAASKIGHENIIDITDFGETASGSVFFAMEFLEGHDLAYHIRESGPMSFERSRHVMNQICRALGAAHSKGIIHRDLKPENIYLVEREGRQDFVKVLDFGIAKISSFDEGGSRLTRTGMIFGTPEYMSPEQARGDKPDHRVDIYAAGCILYEMLTGDVPFHADTFMGVLTKHMFEQPEPPSVRAPQQAIPADVEAVVMRALAKDRDQRFQNMKEMALALEACAGGDLAAAWGSEGSAVMPIARGDSSQIRLKTAKAMTAQAAPVAAEPPRKKSRALLFALLGGLVPVAVIGVVLATRNPPPQPKPIVQPPVQQVAPPKPVEVVPPKPAAPSKFQISVRTEPANADVFEGPELLGATPLTRDFDASSSEHEIVIKKKGFKEQKLKFAPDRNHDFVVTLVKEHSSGHATVRTTKGPATAAPQPEQPKPQPKLEKPADAKPAGKLRDLKDPFAN